jgi:FkbM family methyltransferase
MIGNILRSVVPEALRPMRYMEFLTRTRTGGQVRQGPFAGMRYVDRAVGSAFIPKLLGIYERELIDCVERACAMRFPLIVDIGAAEGYYAVGMARRNPGARVIAFEMEPEGRVALREMAALNALTVDDRSGDPQLGAPNYRKSQLELHGKCEFRNLQAALASAERALVICDVEGYEEILLVPEKIPALGRAHLLVEMHDFCSPGITDRLTERFAPTHEVQRIWSEPRTQADYPFRSLATKLLPSRYLEWAASEWRPERMSWLWLVPKAEILKS